MSNTLKPMLGTSITRQELADALALRPLYASFKLDGIRALVRDGVVLSRSLKPIPNEYVQTLFGRTDLEGFDGELLVGPDNAPDVFRVTTSGVMSESGMPNVQYRVFDIWNMENAPLHERYAALHRRLTPIALHVLRDRLHGVSQHKVETVEAVDRLFEEALSLGFEGLVLRSPHGLYKYGRSTVKEAGLLKMKPFVDAEAIVVGRVELMHNENEAFKNELGRTARSSAKAGKVASGTLGALVCQTPEGVQFEIGTGFTEIERREYWRMDTEIMGKIAKYKSLVIGVKDKPRHAVFLGFRDRLDT